MEDVKRELALEGIITTNETVKNTINRWYATCSVHDCPRSGLPKKVPEAQYQCIDATMAENNELTASALKDILKKRFGVENIKYSARTIARIRNELGWTFTTVRYCQAIRDANKDERLEWCTQRLGEKGLVTNIIFTDGSTFN